MEPLAESETLKDVFLRSLKKLELSFPRIAPNVNKEPRKTFFEEIVSSLSAGNILGVFGVRSEELKEAVILAAVDRARPDRNMFSNFERNMEAYVFSCGGEITKQDVINTARNCLQTSSTLPRSQCEFKGTFIEEKVKETCPKIKICSVYNLVELICGLASLYVSDRSTEDVFPLVVIDGLDIFECIKPVKSAQRLCGNFVQVLQDTLLLLKNEFYANVVIVHKVLFDYYTESSILHHSVFDKIISLSAIG